MSSDVAWGPASGLNAKACHVIAYRYPAGTSFDPATGESWLFENADGVLHARLEKQGWYTDVWRSDTGRVFVTDAAGFVQVSTDKADAWDVHRTTGMLVGVWGLDEAHVYAWGLRNKTDFVLFFNGTEWSELPAPQGGIVSMHGTSPENMFAIGDKGLISRWDGATWTDEHLPASEPLRAIHATTDGTAWCCGNNGGLYRRADGTWSEILRHDAPLGGVVSWNDAVWVGAYGPLGLCKVTDSALASIKPNITGVKIEERQDALLFFSSGLVGHTLDGENFWGYGVSGVAEILASKPPRWK